ncbi:ABC transporter substrate-binding protein [Nocardioides sp. Root122]|uniref:MCE family protein n=1 Tax=Nocardioides TaxID=1839 RepID=UPI00070390BC|nr:MULTISPECIES: MCE family protein [Nocardioides]KQV71526.1 ABC transporter substrate-binding protein [Nocardioides sp. Root122]MCK9822477.1 MCE family protein [Nocardioides cavernae]
MTHFKPFRERNPIVVGAVCLVVMATVMVAALRADDLPVIGGGDTYHAMFTEAGGLKVNDEVRIAGVRVGKVDEIELADDQVEVSFKVDDTAEFGTETRAAIKVKTILGSMFLALEPAGGGQLDEGATIPAERTSSPFDVVEAFEGLASTSEQIDTDQLAESLTTLADLTRNTPEEFRGALTGLSRLSANVAAKDEQLNTLLQNLERVSKVLDARDEDIIALMKDSDVLFRALVARREAVHDLLVSSTTLSKELTALIKQSRADLKPALAHLENVVAVLNKNEDNLDSSLRLMAPFYRVFANTLGTGPWFDTWIANFPPVPQVG